MNLSTESQVPKSTMIKKAKSKKIHQHSSSKQSLLANLEQRDQTESLLSTCSHDLHANNIELGVIDSDEDESHRGKNNSSRMIVRPRQRTTKSISTAQTGGSIVIVEKPVHPNETLQAFAIRYRVPVSQLKRLNNLQNDQDFYALTYCRVPVRRFGLLHETSPSIVLNFHEQSSTHSNSSTHPNQQNHRAFLSAMDHDLELMRAKVEQLIESEPTALIPQPVTTRMIVRSSSKSKSEFNCDGADCGCKLGHIILSVLLVALLVPLVYIYFFLYGSEEIIDHHPQ